jgi:NADP-reducing hydrogenase subunit HndB
MAKLTLEDLKNLRAQKKKELSRRETAGAKAQIIIGMGTCGIAAGAKETFDAILDELEKHGVSGVIVKQTGCMGLCYSEPSVEVIMADVPTVMYGNVNAEVGRQIVTDHIMQGKMISEHVFDKPAPDILKEGE